VRTRDALLGAAERAVHRAQRRGAEEAEAFLWNSEGAGALCFGGTLYPKSYEETGLAVRVATQGRTGLGCVMGDADDALDLGVDQALEVARARPPDPQWRGFADPEPAARAHGAWDARIEAMDLDHILRDARDLAARASAMPDVRFAQANSHAYRYQIAVVNTRGVQAHDQGTVHSVRVEARAGRGARERSMEHALFSRGPVEPGDLPEWVAGEARAGLDASGLAPGTRPVVFAREAAWGLVFLLAHALNGRRVHLAQSALAGKVGEPVYAPALHVDEDVSSGIRTGAIDDEGVPARGGPIVEAGVLRSFFWDTASGRLAGQRSTGNGLRGPPRYQSVPNPWPMNLRVAPGRGSLDDLIAGVADGVLVRGGLMGLNQSNLVSGDFSVVAPSAWRIERGAVTHALPRATLAGNVHRCLRDLQGVGGDPYERPSFAVPSLVVGGITVAG